MTATALHLSTPDDSDELARAEVYGLLAQLFYAPPDDGFYGQLQVAVTEAPARGGFLEDNWGQLVGASRRLGAAAVRDEYAALFLGVGKPELFLYASYYLTGRLNEAPLVELRQTLAGLGLDRATGVNETEDHIAYLCEVMRFLIAGEDVAVSNLATQRRFFDTHLRGWTDEMWNQVANHPGADFYAAAARFAQGFFSIEVQAFDMVG